MTNTMQLVNIGGHTKATVAIPAWAQEMIDHPEGRNSAFEAYKKVPQLYRAVTMRANALACVPFVVRKGEKLVSWPFPQSLSKLLGEMEASLMVAGGAYVLKLQPASGGKRTVGLQFLAPTTMRTHYDARTRVTEYRQRIGSNEYGPWNGERMLFMREFSFTTEVGNGLAPATVALPAANLRASMQEFANGFFSSGGQPMTLLTIAGNPAPTEIDRTERFFKRSMQGVRNAWRVLAMRSEVSVQAITPAINTMAMPEMHETTTREIAAAFGIPLSLLTSDSANYATAQSDTRLFYENTIKARLMMYESAINEQVLAEMGLALKFTPEALAVYQEDEAERSGALLNLVNAGMPLTNAMLILGYAVEDVTGMDATVETVTTSGAMDPVAAAAPKSVKATNGDGDDDDDGGWTPEGDGWDGYAMQAHRDNMATEIKAWGKVAGKSIERALEFNCEHIVPEMENWIKAQLAKPGADAAHLLEHAQGKALRLTNKDQRKLAGTIGSLFKKYGPRIKSAAGDGVVDYATTSELFSALAQKLEPELRSIYIKNIKVAIADNDTPIDTEVYTTRAQDWARSYTFDKLTGELTDTTIKNLQRMVSKMASDPTLTSAAISAGLFPTFSPYRVAMIATTEVTRAKAAAVNGYYDILTSYGDDVVRRWLTSADEGVCPICSPLDRKLFETYSKQFNDGPPGHPNCRCKIAVQVKPQDEGLG